MFYRKYLRHYKKETIIAPLFKFLEAAFELAIPILVAYVIDVGIANGDKGYILKMGAVMVGMGILGLLCSLLAQYYSAVAAFGFGTEVRAACYRRINAFSFKELDGIGIPTLITRITQDVNNAQTGVNRFLRLILRAPFIILGTVVASFLIDWRAGLIFLVTVPVLGAVIYFVMRACIRGNGKIQKNLDEVSLRTRETLAGARVVRAFSRQEEEIAAFDDSVTRLNKLQVAVGRISALLNPATYAIINVAIICILWFGGGLVFQGVLEQGEITALINYMTQDLLAAVAFAELVIMMAQGEASAKRIRALLATEPSMADGAGRTGRAGTADRARRRLLFLRGRRGQRARAHFSLREAGGDRRYHRRDGRGEVHARKSAAPLLRRDGGEREDKGRGRADLENARAPRAFRRRAAESGALFGHHPG